MPQAAEQKTAVQLAHYAVHLNFEDIPLSVVENMKTLVLDYLGVALRGSAAQSAKIAKDFQREYGACKPESTVIGGGLKLTSQAAAFANAVSAHSIELDDVDEMALFHYGPPVISAALAAAESVYASGKEFLLAAVIGCDLMKRLSDAMNPMLRDRGFHTTPVCGVFGAAAAAGRLEGLSAEKMIHALGIAGAHASGLMEMYGANMQKRINPGPAAHNGIVSARLAGMGYTGADTIFDGTRGVLSAFAGQRDASVLVDGLGTKFDLGIEYKRYACARPIHTAIDCALTIRPKILGRVQHIREMTVFRHPSWAHYHQIKNPRNIHEAQVSLEHAVAVAIVAGDAFLEHFDDDWIGHPQVKMLSNMLQIQADPALPRGVSCRLRIVLGSGEWVEAQADYPKGSGQNPMTSEEHREKFEKLAGTRLKAEQVTQIRNLVRHLETLPAINQLAELLY